MKRLLTPFVPLTLVLAMLPTGALAAQPVTIHQQKLVGAYRLVLQVGAMETMSMHKKGATGEVMLGGKASTCSGAGSSMNGMSMGSNACNRHVEVHVYDRSSGRVVTRAHVTITLHTIGTRKTIQVPIMTMVGATSNSQDFHYGNNITAAPGHYTVIVHVNRVRATFSFRLT